MESPEVIKDVFTTSDGATLVYREWKPATPTTRTIVLLHRGHEHSGRLEEVAHYFTAEGYRCFAYDSRGHGESSGVRGYSEDFSQLVRDLHEFVRFITRHHRCIEEDITILANSVSSVVTATWVHDYAPRIRGMVLVAPAFRIKLYVPFALPSLRLMMRFKAPLFITSYVSSRLLTHDVAEQKKYDGDPLITRNVAANVLVSLFDTARRIVTDAGAIEVPTLILSAGSDWVVRLKEQQQFYASLSSKIKEMVVYPGFFHGVLYEKDRAQPLAKALEFIHALYDSPHDYSPLLSRDSEGFTAREYAKLLARSNPLKRIFYGTTSIAMKTIGRLGRGIAIGEETGYDSGLSLDHVYRNTPDGVTLLGRTMDRTYLDAVGWKGIRVRRQHIEHMLEAAIADTRARNEPVRILDIAAGPGRYILEKIASYPFDDIQAILCDTVEENLVSGRRLAEKLHCTNITFANIDAFTPHAYEALQFRPNIIVISGLYELFSDNKKILQSLRNIAKIAQPNATVIYTGQPWHPQLEFIAYTLQNRDGEPWVMRRRTQAELDYLFTYVGCTKQDMAIDPWGIFTVSRATLTADTEQTNH